jgi:sodium-dependent dicarboxylate transporter 2/3/5
MRGIGGKTYRLMFAYMLVVGVISMFVSDAATVAMTIPIGMSLVSHAKVLVGAGAGKTNFGAFVTLGTFYASVAGGAATIMGVPHNAISVSLLEQFTGRQLGFFEWMRMGLPVFVALLVAFYGILWVLVRPEIRDIPSGEAYLRAERAKLGGLRPNERRVMFAFRDDGDALHIADADGARVRHRAHRGPVGGPRPSGLGGPAGDDVSSLHDSFVGPDR